MSKFEEIFIKEKMRFAIVLFVGLILGFSQCNSSDSTANEKLSLDQFLVEIGKEKLTMVDFYTTWCGPCKQMAPFIEEIKMENKDVVNVLKVDAEDQIDIASKYNISGYPTLIFFKNGVVVHESLGGRSKEDLLALINQFK